MTAPGFDPPEKDWGASYDGESFVPQEDDVLVEIADQLDRVADHAGTAARLLERVRLERWKGAAADVFLGYVDRLARHYRTCHRSATTAAGDLRACATSVGNARADADKAAADLTDAQERYEKFKDDKNFIEEMFSMPELLGIANDFNAAYDRGCDAPVSGPADREYDVLGMTLDTARPCRARATRAGRRCRCGSSPPGETGMGPGHNGRDLIRTRPSGGEACG